MAKPIIAVQKAFQVLEALANRDNGIGAGTRELARELDMPKSTVQRILQTLEMSGVVVQDPESRLYSPGPTILEIGFSFVRKLDVRTIALPFMRQLRAESGETVGLTVRMGDGRLYVELLESAHELRAKPALGHNYPLYSGAPGRAILSFLNNEEIRRILREVEVVQLTPNTPVTTEAIWELVENTRSNGFAVAFEETMLGLNTIAAPIFDHRDEPMAALSISGPVSRFSETDMERLREPLLSSALAISRKIGSREVDRKP